jgi:alkanesulfonate monooxygenase SsuD/methylene tetrahydromethanopterin reductase-like flavin-dependent oxidoreductase (luciferase family)
MRRHHLAGQPDRQHCPGLSVIGGTLPSGFGQDFRGFKNGLIGTVDTVKARIAAFEDAGVQELVISFQESTSVEQVTRFAELFL